MKKCWNPQIRPQTFFFFGFRALSEVEEKVVHRNPSFEALVSSRGSLLSACLKLCKWVQRFWATRQIHRTNWEEYRASCVSIWTRQDVCWCFLIGRKVQLYLHGLSKAEKKELDQLDQAGDDTRSNYRYFLSSYLLTTPSHEAKRGSADESSAQNFDTTQTPRRRHTFRNIAHKVKHHC